MHPSSDHGPGASREDWSSRLAFLFAVLGSAIGLGNLWRFPYMTGENGGGAFVLVYLFFSLVIGVPLVMTELAMGRRGHRSPVTTMRALCVEGNVSLFWLAIGWLSILAPILALCFYSVVAGWSLDFIVRAAAGTFSGIRPDAAQAVFQDLLASPGRLFFWHTIYMAASIFVVARGIRHGLEGATKIMMPALFVMMALLVIYAHVAGDAGRAWYFLFNPDFSRLTGTSVLMALGQALFSVSVGTGALITYGSYLSRDVNIPGSSWTIALSDTAAALMAGLAIFPIVFASGLDPGDGPGLMFVTLPIALGQMPGGYFISIMFFVLVFFAAFTSSLAMLEPFVAWMVDKGYQRVPVTIITGTCIWMAGAATVLSFNLLKDFTPLSFIPLYEGRTIFLILDFTVSNISLPLNALLIAMFAGWVISRRTLMGEIGLNAKGAIRAWTLIVRYLAPLAVGATLVYGLLA
ncbi:MAG: sodium-dependent transporter [Gammaproteobacteria bacterium]|nr:sodium-dependent transporter [Gammaproteobacteria bacterium]